MASTSRAAVAGAIPERRRPNGIEHPNIAVGQAGGVQFLLQRRPEFSLTIFESRRHNADHRVGSSPETEGAAENSGIATEQLRPHAMAEHDYGGRALTVLRLAEVAPHERSDAHYLEEVVRDSGSGDADGIGAFAQNVLDVHDAGKKFEGSGAAPPVDEVGPGGAPVTVRIVSVHFSHHHQTVGMRIRKGAPEHRVGDAEHGGVDADSQRQREQRDHGEAAAAQQGTGGEPKILQQNGRELVSLGVWNGSGVAGEADLQGGQYQIQHSARGQAPAGLLLPASAEGGEHFGGELAAERRRKKEQQRADQPTHQARPSGSSLRTRESSTRPARRAASALSTRRPRWLRR
jgi:hypothetical protein